MNKEFVVYISGPMTGLPDNGLPAFFEMEKKLLDHGFDLHSIENPARNPEPPCKSWYGYMRMAVRQVSRSNAVIVLPGWHLSKGARMEVQLAWDLNIPVVFTLESLMEEYDRSLVQLSTKTPS